MKHHNCSNDNHSCDIENILTKLWCWEPYIDAKPICITHVCKISNSKCRVIVEMFSADITSHSKAHF
jgi:hypothetical protein